MVVPAGISSFSEIRESKLDYVDKTAAIHSLLDPGINAYLFTRPRRFGKSLFLSMLDCYLNMKYEGNTWFDGLEITKLRPNDSMKNSFPVIKITMMNAASNTFDSFVCKMRDAVISQLNDLLYLLDSDKLNEEDKADIGRIFERSDNASALESSLTTLCRLLRKHHGRKVVVLIDEYDLPVNECGDDDERQKITMFLKQFYSVMKDEDSLRLGVTTGVMPIAKEGFFSGVNNVDVYNIFDRRFSDSFGFTEKDVKHLLDKNGLSGKFDETKMMYDGYRFGNTDIYNPWDIVKYIRRGGEPKPYWINTGDSSLMDALMDREDSFDELNRLLDGESIPCRIHEKITFSDLYESDDALLSVMSMSGYLKAVSEEDGFWNVSVPNKEIRDELTAIIKNRMNTPTLKVVKRFFEALENSDCTEVEKSLDALLTKHNSFRILTKESDYQNFIFGLMIGSRNSYIPRVEIEAGDGYSDISLVSRDRRYPNVVLELKRIDVSKDDETAEKAAELALEQIVDRRYAAGMEGRTDAYGVVFRGKKTTAVTRRL